MLLDWPQAAVGEVGLDFFRPQPPRQVQLELFQAQLELAAAHDRTVSVHCAKAWGPLQELLRALPVRVVLHGYGGSAGLVAPLVRLGAFFAFSGALTDPRRANIREAAQAVPLDRLLVETDAPAACPWRGDEPPSAGPNEPAHLVQVVACLAQLRGEPADRVAQVTAENGRRVFGV
jgi:TatD DNase family protein